MFQSKADIVSKIINWPTEKQGIDFRFYSFNGYLPVCNFFAFPVNEFCFYLSF
ncbi:hypothetical protein ASZ90_006043 [hydrocarbon metagenome]|uniref:Uncharacterized protein n=1 Tax=hydrocarbon metagenome TaxID=938273 RepID=A0A0W8FTB1_9ZZZZ